MGSSLSPIAADIAMDDLESKCIASLPFKLPFFFRYVDDIITAVPANEIDIIVNTFNSYNHKIQFTTEKELDGKIYTPTIWKQHKHTHHIFHRSKP